MIGDDDRAAILARRAAFVASALAHVGVPLAAYADDTPPAGEPAAEEEAPCAETPTPSPASLDEAKKRVETAQELMDQSRFEEAAVELRRVLVLAYSENVVSVAMKADALRGAPGDAYELGRRHLRCVGPSEAIETMMRQIEAETGAITVRLEDPRGVILEIDGASVDTRRAARGIRVTPGLHKVRAVSVGGQERINEVQVVAGETASVSIAPFPPPMPCLSPHPCLSPPPRDDRNTLLRLQAGAMAPAVAVLPDDVPRVMIGTGASVSVAVQIAKRVWFDGDLFLMSLITQARGLVVAGSNVELKYFPVDAYGFGAGFSGGFFAFPGGSDSLRLEDVSGVFGPVIVPASVLIDRVYIEARVPVWFSPIEDGAEVGLGLGAIAPHLVVGISLPLLESAELTESASSSGRGTR